MAGRIDEGALGAYMVGYPGELICGVQAWYEGLLGHGVMTPEEASEMDAALDGMAGWTCVGDVRYEKYGNQKSWKKGA